MLGVWVVEGVEDLRGRLVSLQGSEGTRDELRSQGVQDVRLFQLQGLQLSLDLLKGDAVEAGVFMANVNEVFPEFPVKSRNRCLLYVARILSEMVRRRERNSNTQFSIWFEKAV